MFLRCASHTPSPPTISPTDLDKLASRELASGLVTGQKEAALQEAFHKEEEEEDDDDDSSDETASACSATESVLESLFRKGEDGRTYQNLNDAYWMPTDEKQTALETFFDQAKSIVWGGLYPLEVRQQVDSLLSENDTRILDLGCGAKAIWLLKMAKYFPRVTAIGLDLVPVALPLVPASCVFEIHDFSTGIPYPSASISLVQNSWTAAWFTRPLSFYVEEVSRVLVSGGVWIGLELNKEMTLWTEDGSPLKRRFPALALFQEAYHNILVTHGQVPLPPDGFLETITASGKFQVCHHDKLMYRVGGREELDDDVNRLGQRALDSAVMRHQAWLARLGGLSTSIADALETVALAELESLRSCPLGQGVYGFGYSFSAIRD